MEAWSFIETGCCCFISLTRSVFFYSSLADMEGACLLRALISCSFLVIILTSFSEELAVYNLRILDIIVSRVVGAVCLKSGFPNLLSMINPWKQIDFICISLAMLIHFERISSSFLAMAPFVRFLLSPSRQKFIVG